MSSKAVRVFEEEGTFFSVCLLPTVFSPERLLLAAGQPEFSREATFAQADFSMLANVIPNGRIWSPTGEYIWSVCEDLFDPSIVEVSVGRALAAEDPFLPRSFLDAIEREASLVNRYKTSSFVHSKGNRLSPTTALIMRVIARICLPDRRK